MKLTLKNVTKTQVAYYERPNFKQTIGIPVSHFQDQEPPNEIDIRGGKWADKPPVKKQQQTGVHKVIKELPPEQRKAVNARIAEARAQALRDQGIDPKTGKPLADAGEQTGDEGM